MRSLNCKATLTSAKHIRSAVGTFNPSENTVYKSEIVPFFGGEQRHEILPHSTNLSLSPLLFSSIVFLGAYTWDSNPPRKRLERLT